MSDSVTDSVKDYYGRVLQSKQDLKTSACCAASAMPDHIREVVKDIDDEVLEKFYGCGAPFPYDLEGQTILDLGCGTGRDVFIASKLVGPEGRVIGIDMTEAQIEVANKYTDSVTKRFGFTIPNVEFHLGYIESIKDTGVADESVDICISNCVLNLCADKQAAFNAIYNALRFGGELYFSDVFVDRRLPAHVAGDPVAVGECLGGAHYYEDFRRMMAAAGFVDVRTVSTTPLSVSDTRLAELFGDAKFYSDTVRAFKLPLQAPPKPLVVNSSPSDAAAAAADAVATDEADATIAVALEDRSEDYGQMAKYLGTCPLARCVFKLDAEHAFAAGKMVPVCGNTAAILSGTRFKKYFVVDGDRSTHYGLFQKPASASGPAGGGGGGGGCC